MNNLRKLRKGKELSLKQLGNYLGMSESTISLYENNKREPDIATLFKLADYFDVSVDYLIGNTDNPQSHKNAGDAMYDFIRSLELLSRATSEVQEHLDHLLNYSIDEKD